MRGASRGDPEVGQARRPRAWLVTSHSGGPGSPSVPTTGDCLQWLDAARTKAGESLPDRASQKPPGSAPGSYGPGDRNRRDGAPRGARVVARRAPAKQAQTKDWCAARRSIPSRFAPGEKREAPHCGAGTTAYPAPQRIGAMALAPSSSWPGLSRPSTSYASASYKSFHSGLAALMSRTFHARGQCFIVFSRWIATRISS